MGRKQRVIDAVSRKNLGNAVLVDDARRSVVIAFAEIVDPLHPENPIASRVIIGEFELAAKADRSARLVDGIDIILFRIEQAEPERCPAAEQPRFTKRN